MCKEGQTFLCVICNRCLYEKSVKWFNLDNYLFAFEEISDIGNRYMLVYLTCDRYFSKKQKIHPQAVWNKLEVFMVPEVLSHLNRLDRVLISRKILFMLSCQRVNFPNSKDLYVMFQVIQQVLLIFFHVVQIVMAL